MISHSLKDTQDFAKKFVQSLDNTSIDSALVVGLYGNLGAGKTTFTQAVAKEMGVEDIVNSPTFVIEKMYETKDPHFIRLESLVENKHNIIFIEWPENVKEILPTDHVKIYCEFIDENSRRFEVQ